MPGLTKESPSSTKEMILVLLECFQKAALLEPDQGDVWLKMGTICIRIKNYDKALEYLDKCP